MSNNKADIQQIQKYLRGELDAKAMHALERQAQDDPFLMDAIEGYEVIGADQRTNFDDIKERFADRTQERKTRSIILWRVLPIAATLLLVFSIGFLWITSKSKQEVPVNPVAAVYNKVVIPPAAVKPNTETVPSVEKTTMANDIAITHRRINIKSTTPPTTAENKPVYTSIKNDTALQRAVAKQVPSLNILRNNINSDGNIISRQSIRFQQLTGRVTDPTGHPLTGVKVAVSGATQQVVTDSSGVFTLITTDSIGTLNIAHSGFDKKQVPFAYSRKRDSLKVVLNEAVNPLATVSVPGYVDDSGPAVREAQPAKGWQAFREYISKNAHMPNGETGRVKLALTVAADGSLSNIRVIRGKNEAMNKKAIDLVMNGPTWKGVKQTKVLKLKIKFSKMDNG